MKKRIVLFTFLMLLFASTEANFIGSTILFQQEPTEEAVQDSVSIDDADPIFYDAEEETDELEAAAKEKNPLTWALYLGGAAIIIIIVTMIIRRSKKEDDDE